MYHLLSWKHSFYSPAYKNNLIGDLSSEMPVNEDSIINVGFFKFQMGLLLNFIAYRVKATYRVRDFDVSIPIELNCNFALLKPNHSH